MERRFETLKEIDEYASENNLTDEESVVRYLKDECKYSSEYANGEKKTRSWGFNLPSRTIGHPNNAKAFYRIGLMTRLLSKQVAARNGHMTK